MSGLWQLICIGLYKDVHRERSNCMCVKVENVSSGAKRTGTLVMRIVSCITGGGTKIWGGVKNRINCPILESSTAFESSRSDTCHLLLRFPCF